MAQNVSLNGVSYSIPDPGDTGWGDDSSDYLVAIASSVLQKSGGSFALTAEVDFGATFGLKSAYFKSRAANIATSGQLRLGNAEGIYWRNAANGANLGLIVNASDELEFNGTTVQPAGDYITALTGDVTATGPGSAAASIASGVITDVMVSGAAAIAYSKLSLTGGIVNADINAAAAIEYSKLALTGGIVNADISGAAAIAYSKLNLSTSIVNADIAAAAAIARTKLASGTADHVLINDGSGVMSSEASLAISRGGTGAATAQEAIDTLLPTQTGNAGEFLTTDGTNASWNSVPAADAPNVLQNLGIAASAAAGALTIALKQADGSTDPSAGSPVKIGLRSTTITSGGYSVRSYTGATSVVIPDTATLGYANGDDAYVFVWAIYDGTNLELAVSSVLKSQNALHDTTAIDTSSDANALYSTNARTGCAIRLLGRVLVEDIATAGTWTAPDEVVLNSGAEDITLFGSVVAAVSDSFLLSTAGYATGEFAAMSNNSVVLTPGKWLLRGIGALNLSTVSDVTQFRFNYYAANGNNTVTTPATLSTLTEVTILAGSVASIVFSGADTTGYYGSWCPMPELLLEISSTVTIYSVGYAAFTTAGNANLYTQVTAVRQGA